MARLRGQKAHISLEDVLPHRPPALLVTQVIEHEEKSARLAGRIPPNHPCVADEYAPAILLVDFAAQAAGALLGLARAKEGNEINPPKQGFLVGLRDTRLLVREVKLDQVLEAKIRLETQLGDLSAASFEVTTDGAPAAEGRLSLSTPS